MVTRAGAFPARKGSRFEAAVVKDQSRLGRLAYRVRRGQGAVVDVLAVEPCRAVLPVRRAGDAQLCHPGQGQRQATGRRA
jgi:hypothetical protein